MSLFVGVQWPVEDLIQYALEERSDGRWAALLQHLECVGILCEEDVCQKVWTKVKELKDKASDQPDRIKNLKSKPGLVFHPGQAEDIQLDRIMNLKSKLESSSIPSISAAGAARCRSFTGNDSIANWELSSLVLPPFRAVWSAVGEQALDQVAAACMAYHVVEVIDPYILSRGQEGELRRFASFAEKHDVTNFKAYGMWRRTGRADDDRLPRSYEDAFERATCAFKNTNIQWEFRLYAARGFHDRFLAFKSTTTGSVNRIVAIGRGVGAFCDGTDHTIFARVEEKWWEEEIKAYDNACACARNPENECTCILRFKKGDIEMLCLRDVNVRG